jgi:hypothetical protein
MLLVRWGLAGKLCLFNWLVLGAVFVIGGLFTAITGRADINRRSEKQRIQISPAPRNSLGLQSRQKMAAQFGGFTK